MTLELAITDLAAAMRELAAATRGAPLGVVLTAGDAAADLAGTPRPDSPAKEATAEQATAAQAAADKPKRGRPAGKPSGQKVSSDFGPANNGDAEGTTYWSDPVHRTIYKLVPGDGNVPIVGSGQITGAAYVEKQAALAAQFPSSATAPAPAASAHTPATATAAAAGAATTKALDYNVVRAALLQVAKDDPVAGRDKVLAILAAVKINTVPELATANAEVLADVMARIATKAPEADSLFG